MAVILDVNGLSLSFTVAGKQLSVLDNVTFSLNKNEILALVGESGCGKSVTCMSIGRLNDESLAQYDSGEINFYTENGKINILDLSKKELRKLRKKKISYIFQNPITSLNPVFKIGDQIAESVSDEIEDVNSYIVKLLEMVGISSPETRIECYPHELSGGMQQRVMIAMALASSPEILIADEPTTALDVTIQAQILEIFYDIKINLNTSIILVTHDLGIVSDIADRVAVMYAGQIVEIGRKEEVILNPFHPYTKALLESVPKLGNGTKRLKSIPGFVPEPEMYTDCCRFLERCWKYVLLNEKDKCVCRTRNVDILSKNNNHSARCHFA